jgi:hypothetical protein
MFILLFPRLNYPLMVATLTVRTIGYGSCYYPCS